MNYRTAMVLCGCVLAVVGLFSWALAVGDSPRVHDDRDGVLSANSGSGGNALNAPRGRTHWYGTFGTFILCVTEPGARARLTGVRFDGAPKPLSATFRLREVPERAKRAKGLMWTPIGSANGRWPSFSFGRAGGTLAPVRGTVIDQSCDADDDEVGFTELLVQLESGPEGGRVRHLYIDYTVDGEARTLRTHWQLVLCGRAITDVCQGGRNDDSG